jgi:hypothetical protein
MNWTGHLIASPRSSLEALLQRDEVSSTGVYLLLGDDPSGEHEVRAYFGEGDSIDARLRIHARSEEAGGKDFWDRVIVITSKDANITKGHARYLESRLIQLAREAKRCVLENNTAPDFNRLPEADISDMEYFISQLRIVLPVLGVSILRSTRPPRRESAREATPGLERVGVGHSGGGSRVAWSESPVFRLRVATGPDRYAEAREVDSEFVVLAGSFASSLTGVMSTGYEATRDRLVDNGILEEVAGEPKVKSLKQDYVFRSPSEAASVMTGGSENGRKRWVDADGVTYGVWQASRPN